VINLCGQSLADHRWTPAYKKALYRSRLDPARFLARLCGEATQPPECYIGASGIGIYGDQGAIVIPDDSPVMAEGFIPELVDKWENAHMQVPCDRKVILRMGVVLSSNSAFVKRLRLPMRFAIYPYFGMGRQLMSWVHLHDLTRMFSHCIRTTAEGIYHATSSAGITNKDLMRALSKAKGGPGLLLPVPRLLLQLIYGEMSGLLFESADVRPDKIVRSGFIHRYPDIGSALDQILNDRS
jgi:uncharacterized protein (TIGR01777 family)